MAQDELTTTTLRNGDGTESAGATGKEQRSPTRPEQTRSSSKSGSPSEATDEDESSSNNRRFALLIFIAVALGQIVGFAASVNDARELVAPILELVAPAPELRVVGSGTILEQDLQMAAEWQADFEESTRWDVQVPLVGTVERTNPVMIDAIGSVMGFEEAKKGAVHLLAASEPLPESEQQAIEAAGITVSCAAEIGYDVVAFVTDMNNTAETTATPDEAEGEDVGTPIPSPAPALSRRELSSILTGDITDWSEVGGKPGPINILYRPGSGTTEIIMLTFTGSTEPPPTARECESNEHCLNLALSTPGSFYWVSSAWLRTQPPRYLNVIPVQKGATSLPENPLHAGFQPDNYPSELSRSLYMYVLSGGSINPESSELARQFLAYVRGVRGQEILESHSFYTLFDPPADVEEQLPPGFGSHPGQPPVVCR